MAGKYPQDLYRVHPGTFERIIAEIFKSQGYEVELLGQWNQADGGIDVLAVHRSTMAGEFRIGIQCKRYVKTQIVNADIVWALVGRLQKYHLHKGVIATTARFEQSVLKEVNEHLWQIELKDFQQLRDDLETWSNSYDISKGGILLP
jgi:restriction system protein